MSFLQVTQKSVVLIAALLSLVIAGVATAFWAPLIGEAVAEYQSCGLPARDQGRFVTVPAGGFVKGADAYYPEEGQPVRLSVPSFQLLEHEVTNDQFAEFVRSTGYVTEAEAIGGSAQFLETATPVDLQSWWRLDFGATWRTPGGKGTNLDGLGAHPVVHVTLTDARAYAEWAGGRIPDEIEWEYAASLGLFDPDDPVSGIRSPEGEPRANTWTGIFPVINSEQDGFAGTAPVGCYDPSLIGAYDMIGNVWEWTESRFGSQQPLFTIKGGSYLCSSDFCRRYRPAARQPFEPDFSSAHIGFRIIKDPDP